MKTRVNIQSTVMHGFGGIGAEALALIYEYLLNKNNQNEYGYIGIIQVATVWQETIFRSGKSVHINVFYPANADFEQMSVEEKNLIRLDLVNTALLRIADYENKLSKEMLNLIKEDILKRNFNYEIKIKSYVKKIAKETLEAEITVVPKIDAYQLFFIFKKADLEIWRAPFFLSSPSISFNNFFSKSKWKSNQQLIIYEKFNEFAFDFLINKKEVKLIYMANQKAINSYNNNAAVTQRKFDYIPPEGVIIYSES